MCVAAVLVANALLIFAGFIVSRTVLLELLPSSNKGFFLNTLNLVFNPEIVCTKLRVDGALLAVHHCINI